MITVTRVQDYKATWKDFSLKGKAHLISLYLKPLLSKYQGRNYIVAENNLSELITSLDIPIRNQVAKIPSLRAQRGNPGLKI